MSGVPIARPAVSDGRQRNAPTVPPPPSRSLAMVPAVESFISHAQEGSCRYMSLTLYFRLSRSLTPTVTSEPPVAMVPAPTMAVMMPVGWPEPVPVVMSVPILRASARPMSVPRSGPRSMPESAKTSFATRTSSPYLKAPRVTLANTGSEPANAVP